MEIDNGKVDEAVLAVLYLTLHETRSAWKTLDWEAMGRLHEKGLISNPAGKQKSVTFTDNGLREAEQCYRRLFAKS